MRKYIVLTIGALIMVSTFWVGSQPPSDEAIIAIYHQHLDSLIQLVQLYQEDQVGLIVHKNGAIFPTEAARQLPSDRLDLYKALVKEIGVTRMFFVK